jgi:hypothetical protein
MNGRLPASATKGAVVSSRRKRTGEGVDSALRHRIVEEIRAAQQARDRARIRLEGPCKADHKSDRNQHARARCWWATGVAFRRRVMNHYAGYEGRRA